MEIERKIEQAGIKLPETSKSDMIFVPVSYTHLTLPTKLEV